jgi:lipoate-protein ligase A
MVVDPPTPVNVLDLTLPSPAANLALDEALLDAGEADASGEVLRFWESAEYFVVVGYSNRVAGEVHASACRANGVPIHRRCTGGGTVLQGPGCLNYSLVLRIDRRPPLSTITAANCHIMGRHKEVFSLLLNRPVKVQGHTDLAVDGLKFSGNAQRRRRRALLFHGTFLLDFDLPQVEKFLPFPSRQPDYRAGRSHHSFLTNIKLNREAVKKSLQRTWGAETPLSILPDYEALVAERYARDDWNLKL